MPIPQRKQKQTEPITELGSVGMMSSAITTQIGPDGHANALQMASALQTTLELEELLTVFSAETQKLIPHDSITYENKSINIDFTIGEPEKHSYSYQLVIAAQSLGQLILTRKKKFTSDETTIMENLLCCLVYPLRNAIMYKHAITAALKDPLTGINNRTAMNSALIRETELSRRYGTPLSLIAMDIDRFKVINDNYGHLAGDYVLKTVSGVITDCTRSSDILFRSGGEEFLIVLSNTDKSGAMMLSERIRHNIEVYDYNYGENAFSVSASLGVSCYAKGDDSESLFEKADTALYCAKADGRNCIRYSDIV